MAGFSTAVQLGNGRNVSDTRYNSQGYPILTAVLQDKALPTAAAKAHGRDNFKAVARQQEMGNACTASGPTDP